MVQSLFHVITTISRGGAENHLLSLVREQRRRGIAVSVGFLKGDAAWASEYRRLGVQLFPLDLHFYGDPRPLLRLRRAIVRARPQVIHAHLPPAELYTVLARTLLPSVLQVPLVVTKHNDEPFFRGWGASWLGQWVSRRCAAVISISGAVRRFMAQDSCLSKAALSPIIHYGIDAEPFSSSRGVAAAALRRAWGVAEDGLLLGTIARLVPQKDIPLLLRAFAEFQRMTPVPAWLVVVGTGPLGEQLRALAHELGIGGRVLWPGARDDIPDVLQALDIFALTSAYEGFGLVLLEAMASGRPVVGTAVSAIPEVVEHQKSGILVDSRQPVDVAQAFRALLDPQARAAMGRCGQERVRSYFGLERMVNQTLQVYEAVHGRRPSEGVPEASVPRVVNGCSL